MIPG
ncbi:glycosyltransferase, partial [Yersinia pestis PY-59]|jgi:hypothetical protein